MPVNWFDFAVLAILTWGAVNGYFRGLTLSLFNVMAWLSGLVLALYAKEPTALFVNQQYGLNPLITRVLSQNMDLPMKVTAFQTMGDDLPAFIQYMPVNTSTKMSMWEYFYREGEQLIYQGGGPAEFLYSWMAESLVQIICFAAALTVFIALFKVVEGAWVLKREEKIMAEFKSLAGLFTGFLKNFLLLAVIILLVSPMLEVFDFFLLEDLRTSWAVNIIHLIRDTI